MNILLIEDNIDHAELISDMLHSAFKSKLKLMQFSTLTEGLAHLNRRKIDLILCDLKLPDSDINNTVEKLKHIDDAPAIIVLTSLQDEDLANQLVKDGIQDYLPKGEMTESYLTRACTYAIERRSLSQSLLNKNEDYKAFCYSLTHDFRGSLWQISGFAERFQYKAKSIYPNDTQLPFEFLDKIVEKVDGINQLVNDLQDYLSLDVDHPKFSEIPLSLAVNQAVEQLNDTISSHHNASVVVGELPTITANLSQMQLLFSNLISNAIKYNDSSNIRVEISANNDANHYHEINVKDNGMGISKENLERIFIPFERLPSKEQRPGSGLGLSIVKRIIQHHQGRITVTSTEGKGTTFQLSLPKTESIESAAG